ncbi:MAG: amidinotransferase [Cyclobacteriaceae bacterium]|nr:amidinotransferase [Cyclobacteriaceae bacterium]
MVRPDHFGFNYETAESNAFQQEILIGEKQIVKQLALDEFDAFVDNLRKHQIDVYVFDSPMNAPDAVFPNNWVSFHDDGKVVIYPMLTANRRIERQQQIMDVLQKDFVIDDIINVSGEEEKGRILEGTGSIVFDDVNKRAYANGSPRTDRSLFYEICDILGYEGVYFKATDEEGTDIYHTNVLMTVGDGYAVLCKEAVDEADRESVLTSLYAGGLEVVEITYEQMRHFAGNMIQLESKLGHQYLVMSKSAFEILELEQKEKLAEYVDFIFSDIHTIETIGGGSARCMIAGIFLPRKVAFQSPELTC